MILVDSSVWVDYFRSADTPQVTLLDSLFGRTRIAVGDLVAAEVLQGVRDDTEFKLVKRVFDTFNRLDLCGYDLALKASDNYRFLRAKGITVRKTIDTLIATRCIEDGITLLHSDRDFVPFAKHLGLREAYSGSSGFRVGKCYAFVPSEDVEGPLGTALSSTASFLV